MAYSITIGDRPEGEYIKAIDMKYGLVYESRDEPRFYAVRTSNATARGTIITFTSGGINRAIISVWDPLNLTSEFIRSPKGTKITVTQE